MHGGMMFSPWGIGSGRILTVTDVSAGTGLSFEKAEEALTGMVDASRVNMRVTDSGVIVYEFTEILAKNRIDAEHPPAGP